MSSGSISLFKTNTMSQLESLILSSCSFIFHYIKLFHIMSHHVIQHKHEQTIQSCYHLLVICYINILILYQPIINHIMILAITELSPFQCQCSLTEHPRCLQGSREGHPGPCRLVLERCLKVRKELPIWYLKTMGKCQIWWFIMVYHGLSWFITVG